MKKKCLLNVTRQFSFCEPLIIYAIYYRDALSAAKFTYCFRMNCFGC